MKNSNHWQIQPQEQSGDYMFSGRLKITPEVLQQLPSDEISQIIRDLFIRVRENNGCDFIQTFKGRQGRTILCVDQLNKSMKSSHAYTSQEIRQHDFWIMMFDEQQ